MPKTSNPAGMWPERYLIRALALLLICCCGAAGGQDTAPEDAARQVVETLHQALADASANPDYALTRRYEILAPVVRESHDLDYIARFILRRRWDDLSAEQQQDFRERFEELSVTSYASRFTGLDIDALTTTDAVRLRDDRVQVDSTLTTDDGRIVTLSYTLGGRGGTWRIINVIADGVSDLALRRSEYARVLSDDGFDALLERIDSQIAELR